VSAVSASPSPGVEELDAVRTMQRTLYRAAKADPGRRFHALYDKVYRRDVLQRAWELVRRNGGAAGIDQITLKQVEEYGVARLLDELAADLRSGSTVRCHPGGPASPSRARRSGGHYRSP
jgi:RNA-directed DNA polymerase